MRKTARVILILSILSIFLVAAGVSAKVKQSNSWTFDAKKKVVINTVSGDCMVSKSTDGKIHIAVEYAYDPDDSYEPVVRERGRYIDIDEKKYHSNSGYSTWKVEVPEKTEVRFSTASGDLLARELTNEIDASTASGSIELDQCKGEFSLNTASGDIEAYDCSGLFELNTASGDIGLDGCEGEFHGNTASGSIDVVESKFSEASGFSTASGRVDVGLAETIKYDLTLSSASGRVTLDYNGNPIKGQFAFTSKTHGGRISAPFEFQEKRSFRRWGDSYTTKTARLDSDEPYITLETASGHATLKDN